MRKRHQSEAEISTTPPKKESRSPAAINTEVKARLVISLNAVRHQRGLKGVIHRLLSRKPQDINWLERIYYTVLRRYELPGATAILSSLSLLLDPGGDNGYRLSSRYVQCLTLTQNLDKCKAEEWREEIGRQLQLSTALGQTSIPCSQSKPSGPLLHHRFRGSGLFSELNALTESMTYAALHGKHLVCLEPQEQNSYYYAFRKITNKVEPRIEWAPMPIEHSAQDITETAHQWFTFNKFDSITINDFVTTPFLHAGLLSNLLLETWRSEQGNHCNNSCFSRSVSGMPSSTTNGASLSFFVRLGDKVGAEAIPIKNRRIASMMAIDIRDRPDIKDILIYADSEEACTKIANILREKTTNSIESRAEDRQDLQIQAVHPPHQINRGDGYDHATFAENSDEWITMCAFENMLFLVESLIASRYFSGDPLCNLVQFACRCSPSKYQPSAIWPFFP